MEIIEKMRVYQKVESIKTGKQGTVNAICKCLDGVKRGYFVQRDILNKIIWTGWINLDNLKQI